MALYLELVTDVSRQSSNLRIKPQLHERLQAAKTIRNERKSYRDSARNHDIILATIEAPDLVQKNLRRLVGEKVTLAKELKCSE